jgi:hypothetical protein
MVGDDDAAGALQGLDLGPEQAFRAVQTRDENQRFELSHRGIAPF